MAGRIDSNGRLTAKPEHQRLWQRLGYNSATSVTIVVEATKGKAANSDAPAIAILREITRHVKAATSITR